MQKKTLSISILLFVLLLLPEIFPIFGKFLPSISSMIGLIPAFFTKFQFPLHFFSTASNILFANLIIFLLFKVIPFSFIVGKDDTDSQNRFILYPMLGIILFTLFPDNLFILFLSVIPIILLDSRVVLSKIYKKLEVSVTPAFFSLGYEKKLVLKELQQSAMPSAFLFAAYKTHIIALSWLLIYEMLSVADLGLGYLMKTAFQLWDIQLFYLVSASVVLLKYSLEQTIKIVNKKDIDTWQEYI